MRLFHFLLFLQQKSHLTTLFPTNEKWAATNLRKYGADRGHGILQHVQQHPQRPDGRLPPGGGLRLAVEPVLGEGEVGGGEVGGDEGEGAEEGGAGVAALVGGGGVLPEGGGAVEGEAVQRGQGKGVQGLGGEVEVEVAREVAQEKPGDENITK